MAVEPLRDDLNQAGKALLAALDRVGLRPQGAGWFYSQELEDWRFYVASPLVEAIGRKKLYSALVDALGTLGNIDGLSVFDIHLTSPDDPLFRLVGDFFGMREDGNIIIHDLNLIDERTRSRAHIEASLYRWDPTPLSAREIRQLASRFMRGVEKARERA